MCDCFGLGLLWLGFGLRLLLCLRFLLLRFGTCCLLDVLGFFVSGLVAVCF